jgi:hypothetical protein
LTEKKKWEKNMKKRDLAREMLRSQHGWKLARSSKSELIKLIFRAHALGIVIPMSNDLDDWGAETLSTPDEDVETIFFETIDLCVTGSFLVRLFLEMIATTQAYVFRRRTALDETEQRAMLHLESLGPPAAVEAQAPALALAGSAPAEAPAAVPTGLTAGASTQTAQSPPEKRVQPEARVPPQNIDGLRACVARYLKDRNERNLQPFPPFEK